MKKIITVKLKPKDSSVKNLLPYNGEVIYYGTIFSLADANNYFKTLIEKINWQHDEVKIFGKHIITKRKVAWYGTKNFSYKYSNTTKQALTFTSELETLNSAVEKITGIHFNSCLLNLYHNGAEGMSWHSDNEKPLGENPNIASLSFGAERKFCFRHKQTKQMICVYPENGSLLLMRSDTQTFWRHALLKATKINEPRINLTFRNIIE